MVHFTKFLMFLLASSVNTTTTNQSSPLRAAKKHLYSHSDAVQLKGILTGDGSTVNIREWTALGDSYAAGVGAGNRSDGANCSVYSQSYPNQLASILQNSGALRGETPEAASALPTFNNIPCAGSTTSDLASLQLPRFGRPDVATLSVGGNDAHFFAVINACIFRFNGPFYSGDCEREMLSAFSDIRSYLPSSLEQAYDGVLDAADAAGRPDLRLFVTGYARFFDDTTEQCEGVAFNYWRIFPQRDRLTRELRARINGLVTSLGKTMAAAVHRVNLRRGSPVPRIIYVDIDQAFEGHRFCEEGVIEPDYLREDTWFINLYTPALTSAHDNSARRLQSEGDDEGVPTMQKLLSPLTHLEYDMGEGASAVLPPDDWLRVFHPTSLGHRAIKDAVLDAMLRVYDDGTGGAC